MILSKSFFCLSTTNFFFLRLDHFVQLLNTSSVIIGLEFVFSNLCLTISKNLLSLSFQKNPNLFTSGAVSRFLDTRNLWVKWANNGSPPRSIMTDWRRQTGRQAFFLRVIGSSSARIEEHLADGDVIVVGVIGGPLLAGGFPGCIRHKPPWWSGRRAHNMREAHSRPGCQGPQRSCTGICPPHHGRWSWRAEWRTGWSERKWGRRSERRCRGKHRDNNQIDDHACDGMSADPHLSQCSDVIWTRKQSRDADNRRKHTNNKGASMHDAFMPIGIRTTLTDFQVFQVTSHIVGIVVLCAEIPIHLLSMHPTYSLLICTKIPCKGSHCLNKFTVRKWTCDVLCSQSPLPDKQSTSGPRSWSCERVVLGKGTMVLISKSAQGTCPPYHGRRGWRPGEWTGRQERRWTARRGRDNRRESEQPHHERVKMGWSEMCAARQTWAN